jgi:hypothetical protein
MFICLADDHIHVYKSLSTRLWAAKLVQQFVSQDWKISTFGIVVSTYNAQIRVIIR